MKIYTKSEIESYTDEDKFTEEVVLPLINLVFGMSGFSNNGVFKVEYWGKNKRLEGLYGFDVYCGYYDHFHKSKHIAVQCKIGNITLGSNATLKSSIETIKNQIDKSYKAEFTSPLDHKSPVKIDGFCLVTSGSIGQTARDYFRRLSYTNLDCMDANELAFLYKKYSLVDQRFFKK